jgi:hypothetical protein
MPCWPTTWALRSYQADLRRVSRLQVDAAILFEQVTRGLKIFGDQYALIVKSET